MKAGRAESLNFGQKGGEEGGETVWDGGGADGDGVGFGGELVGLEEAGDLQGKILA